MEAPNPHSSENQTAAIASSSPNAWQTEAAAWILMVIGAAVRLRMYLANISLWRDEAALALNIVNHSFSGLFRPLDYEQGAPVGFLMIEKLAVTRFGGRELVLRFWPMLASLLTLPLFYFLCRRLSTRRGAIIALAILALSADKLFYWTDVKQYSTDVLLAVGLLWLAVRSFQEMGGHGSSSLKSYFPLAVSGAVAVWFSHPAIFVLSGIIAAAVISWLGDKPRLGAGRILFLAAVWAGSFLAVYFLSLRSLTHNDYLQHYWSDIEGAYAPIPKSLDSFIWYKRSFFRLFRFPFSTECEGLAGLIFLAGFVAIWRENKSRLAMLLVPILGALAASAMHKYPFDARLILFVFPMTTIFIAAGLNFLWQGPLRMIAIIALVLLMISPLTRTVGTLQSPPKDCELRDSMAFAAAHHQPGDIFYLDPTAEHGFEFYQARFGLARVPVVIAPHSAPSLQAYADELSQFAAKRVWILIEDPFSGDPVRASQWNNEQPMVLDVLDGLGKCLWKHQPNNEYVACYDLTNRAAGDFKKP